MPFLKNIHDFIITTLGARGFLHHGKAPASELPSCDCGGKKKVLFAHQDCDFPAHL